MSTTSTSPDRILLFDDVAMRLRRTPGQVRWMLHTGQLPQPAKIGGRLCWRESQIEAFIDEAFAKAGA